MLIPSISSNNMPEEERGTAHLFSHALSDLQRYITDFAAAISLMDIPVPEPKPNSDDHTTIIQWHFIAARDGAMSVYHFGKTLHALHSSYGSLLPTLWKAVDTNQFKIAWRLFDSQFPHIDLIRHAVAHSGELTRTPKDYEQNVVTGAYTGHGIKMGAGASATFTFLSNRTFVISIEKKVLAIEISMATLAKMDRCAMLFYSGLHPAPAGLVHRWPEDMIESARRAAS